MRTGSQFVVFCICIGLGSIILARSSDSVEVKTLIKLVKQQQVQIKRQGQQINVLTRRLNQLSQTRVVRSQYSSSKQPSTHAMSKSNFQDNQSGNAVHIHEEVNSPTQDSVLLQASGESDVATIPKPKWVIGNRHGELSIYGQINTLAFYTNDGKRDETFFSSNSNSTSWLNFNSKLFINPDLVLGSKIQMGFETNPSRLVSQKSSTINSIDMRKVEMYLQSTRYGTLYFGKGETASDYTAEADLSGTKLVAKSAVANIGGGLFFRNATTNKLSTTQVRNAFINEDGIARQTRIRYDSPSWHGLMFATSLIEDRRSDAALKFGHQFGNTKVAAEVAYSSPQTLNVGSNEAHGNVVDGSATVLFPFGGSLTAAVAELQASNSGRKNPKFYYVKPGYQFKYFKVGMTATAVDYGRYDNMQQNSDEATTWGASVVQNIDPWNFAVYAGWREFVLQRVNERFKTIHELIAGAIFKF